MKFQGDVGIIKIEKADKELSWKAVESGFVVAEGEISGHHHRLVLDRPDTKVEIAKDERGWFLKKHDDNPVTLVHDTHGAQTVVERGIYFLPVQREYDEIAERKVID